MNLPDSSTEITIGMASFPPRESGMVQVVKTLLPQCTRLCLYLNEYTAIPSQLPIDPKLVVTIGGKNLSSHGKFVSLGKYPGYFLSVDDDIHYPADYVKQLVAGLERNGRGTVCGVHGYVFETDDSGRIVEESGRPTFAQFPGYDQELRVDRPVHCLGNATMIMYPSAVGAAYESVFTSKPGTGDDEDLALWAQRRRIPMVTLARNSGWMEPNWEINARGALSHDMRFLAVSASKHLSWRHWRINTMEYPEFLVPPVLTEKDNQYLSKTISSDALFAVLMAKLRNGERASVIRTADGERALLDHAINGAKLSDFLRDPAWLTKYGLAGTDLAQVGRDLLEYGNRATYLACSISGLFMPGYNTHQFFPNREVYADQFFPTLWEATGRVEPLLRQGPVLVLHREHQRVCGTLTAKYNCAAHGLSLSSWRDHEPLMTEVAKRPERLVLVSGGPSGKPFCVKLAEATGKVVLDVGEALTGVWARPVAGLEVAYAWQTNPAKNKHLSVARPAPQSNHNFSRRW
jgi:hypothetical protein